MKEREEMRKICCASGFMGQGKEKIKREGLKRVFL